MFINICCGILVYECIVNIVECIVSIVHNFSEITMLIKIVCCDVK